MLKVVILVKHMDINPHCPTWPLAEQGLPIGIVLTQVLDDPQNVPGGQTPVPCPPQDCPLGLAETQMLLLQAEFL